MNPDLEFLAPQPDPIHRRTGRIARLPKATRDQLNQMILDGVPHAEIIQKLGEEGKDLVEKNLTTWRAGAYQDWLRQQQRLELIQSKHEMAMDLLGQNAGTNLYEASRQIATAQLCELISKLQLTPANSSYGHLKKVFPPLPVKPKTGCGKKPGTNWVAARIVHGVRT